MSESSNTVREVLKVSTWQKPELRRVGNVGDVLQFPGNGKVSNATEDMGDTPYKPSGLEPK